MILQIAVFVLYICTFLLQVKCNSETYNKFNKQGKKNGKGIMLLVFLSTKAFWLAQGEMNFLGNKYYKLNRRLLLLVGLWPYDHSLFKYYQVIFCNITVALMVTFQVRTLHKILKMLPVADCLLTKYKLIWNLKI